ncbi:MAG: hypothetical protein Q4F21_08685 [Lachnospiraceae bacterium]|nr:hypothetical protein [Lachnospiraceae bacterium]
MNMRKKSSIPKYQKNFNDSDFKQNSFSDSVPFQVTSKTETSAAIISAECTLLADHNQMAALLCSHLEKLAEQLNEKGAFIGHIKASMDVHTLNVFSLTDKTVNQVKGKSDEITFNLAAILFLIEEQEAVKLVTDMLKEITNNQTIEPETGGVI